MSDICLLSQGQAFHISLLTVVTKRERESPCLQNIYLPVYVCVCVWQGARLKTVLTYKPHSTEQELPRTQAKQQSNREFEISQWRKLDLVEVIFELRAK